MTKDEVRMLLTLIQAEYPQSFVRLDERQMALKLELWTKEFANDDSNVVYAAARTLMSAGRDFAPNCGQIRDKMREFMEIDVLDEHAAWLLVSKATSNGRYGFKKEFEALPPDVQAVVGSPEQLRTWAGMEADTVESVVASNFMRAYRTRMNRKREFEKIPDDIKKMILGTAEIIKLPEVSE